MRSLLVVGAYRDNEVTPGHPLISALDSARRAGAKVSDLVVGPLSSEHLTALVADALHCSPREAEPLAALVLEKTGANPFFVVQFLGVLYQEGLIAFDPGAGRWGWDVAKIRAQGYTDNVVELMVGKLRHLPVETQEALELAACIGAIVDSETLAAVCQRDPEPALRPALEADLLLRLERTYRFPHDRVQEAAYSLIPDGERAAVHLRIGRLLLACTAPGEVENEIFKIVNQLDRGSTLITSREEREQAAELNLVAGMRARRSTAYASALKYLTAGTSFLAEDSWGRRYGLAFALELHRAECEYLTGALKAAEERLSMLWHRAKSLSDLAGVTCLRLHLYTTLDQSDRGVKACLDYLRRLGIQWSPHPTGEEVRQEYDRIWRQLGSRPIEDLIDLPLMNDPDWRVTMDVLTSLHTAALFTDENLLCLSIGRMANLSLEHGHCDGSSLAYVWLGMILGPYFGDYRAALRFGELGLDLVKKRGLDRFKARVYLDFANFVNPWARHIRTSRELLRRAFDAATKTGDLTYAAFSCNVFTLLATGEALGDVQREAEDGLAFARKMRFGLVVDVITSQLRLIRNVRGLTPTLASFNDEEFDEGRFERHLEADPRLAIATCWYWVRKLQSRVFAEDHASAIEAAAKADALLWTTRAFFEVAEYHYYGALARAGHHDVAPADERTGDLELLVAHCKQLELWAKNCPENFEDRHALVSAELARIEGRELDAERLYEQAIRAADKNGFVHNEALAYELASKFYRARGYGQFADVYLRDARACYLRWGADGKVRQLEQLYPQLVERRPLASATTVAIRAEQLDLLSVVKASQTISGKILLEDLLGTLLRVVLEQGGAERACLLRARGNDLSMEAEATAGAGGLVSRLLPSLPLESPPLVPISLVQYTRQTREPVILDDAAREPGKFSSDPYFARRRPRSVLCLPILRQTELLGFLYLENDLVAGAFTPDRLTALRLLASQAAISMENALLLSRERASREQAERATQALSESEERLRLAQDAAKAGTWEWDLRTNENFWSEGTFGLYGLEPHSIQPSYESWRATIHPEDRSRAEWAVQEAARGGTELNVEWRVLTRNGTTRWLMSRGRPVRDPSGQVVRYRGITLDITDRKRAEEALLQENRRKSEFIAVLSHELRNPLAPIRTGLQLLRRSPPGSPVTARAWQIMERQTEHMTRLVDDLLDVTRISRGKIELKRARVDLREVVRASCDDLRSLLERGGVVLRLELLPDPIWIDADAMRVSQVVGNLLQNAAKFTAAGGSVTVGVTVGGGRAEISVTDTGVGMEPGEVNGMFEPFAQAAQDLARTKGGLGLGLALAKGLVELHGGSIRARSEGPGRGSEFVVSLPLA